ncbi:MAG: hypothetical protein K5853_10155 [Lachnospiraceae bacterium]|nr:hypothetical protein [Lachnospiraceae bacterium]
MNKKLAYSFLFVLCFSLLLCGCKNDPKGTDTKKKDKKEEVTEEVDYGELPVKNLELLAMENDPEAAYRLGQIYDYGLSEQNQDFEESKKWYENALNNGDNRAPVSLGYMYLNGCGVPIDYDKAMEYFNMAVDMDNPEGYVGIGRVYLDQKDESNYFLAYKNIRIASDLELLDGFYYMGYLYENGYGVPMDIEKAMLSYQLVLLNPSEDVNDQFAINSANTRLGIIYATGKTGEIDGKKAHDYFEVASDNGFVLASYYLGMMYEMGTGIDKDYDKALEYFELAGEKDYAPALNQIGYMYFNGLGVESDYEQAAYYQKLAAVQGYAPAQVNLGFLYENGYGVELNPDTALQYYKLAYEQDYEGASEAITRVENMLQN